MLWIDTMIKNSLTSTIKPTAIVIRAGVFRTIGNFFIRYSSIPAVQRRQEAHAKTM